MSREARPVRGRRFQRDLSDPIEERCFEVGAPDDGRRLDLFLAERMAWRSRQRIQELIAADRVAVGPEDADGSHPLARGNLRAGTRLRRGDRVIVRLDSAFVDAATAQHGGDDSAIVDAANVVEIEVVYEDDRLLAVDKPPRMNVYPTRRHPGSSLTELVHRRHRALGLAARALVPVDRALAPAGPPPSPCHRLDRETSGLVLFAKDRATRADVGRQFEERTVEKTYLALVAGAPIEDEGTIELPLGRDLASRVEIKQGPRLDGGGLASRTRWRVLARFGTLSASRALVELRPLTGRQHQLRAHLAAIGHPILGDRLYLGGDELFLASLDRELTEVEVAAIGDCDRLALHATRLRLRHPGSGRMFETAAPAPERWATGVI